MSDKISAAQDEPLTLPVKTGEGSISIEADIEHLGTDIEKLGEDVVEEVETALSHG